jgi:hypothetical protein
MKSWSKPWQISTLGAGEHTVSMSCCLIEIGEFKQTEAVPDTVCSPVKVVCEEDHDGPFAVDFDPGHNAAQTLRILSAGFGSYQNDLVLADDVALRFTQTFAANAAAQVVLGAYNPEDTAFGEVEKVGKVNVDLVDNGNLTSLQSSASQLFFAYEYTQFR